MSVPTEYFNSMTQAGHASASGIGKEAAKWGHVALGAVALGLYLVLAATAEVPWPVMIGPFVLFGVARLMGLRSIWRVPLSGSNHQGKPSLALLEQALRHFDAHFRKARIEMASLESRVEEGEPLRVIEKLKAGLEKTGNDKATSAYEIGRQYMRLGQYEEAREWLRRAQRLSSCPSALEESLKLQQSACNLRLLDEGDALFEAGDFHGARERFARLSQGLAEGERVHLAVFLRSACVYSKLRDYEDAAQAVLQALKTGEETEKALALLDLLQKLSNPEEVAPQTIDVRERIEAQIADHVARLMEALRTPGRESNGASSR